MINIKAGQQDVILYNYLQYFLLSFWLLNPGLQSIYENNRKMQVFLQPLESEVQHT